MIETGSFLDSIVIREYQTKDKHWLSKIYYSIRRSMTQNGFIWVAEDQSNQTVVGGICVSEKLLKINGKERIFFYPFDACVDPKYRACKVLKRLSDRATDVYMQHSEMGPIIYTSTACTNGAMGTFYKDSVMQTMAQQVQHAWHVKNPVTNINYPNDKRIRIWKERNPDIVKAKFSIAFQNYEMVPVDFDDLILNRFWKYSYFAQYKVNDTLYEASISIWDQNKVCKLINLAQPNSKRQQKNDESFSRLSGNFFQLFGCYSTEKDNDYLFTELLKYVHNDCFEMGIEYLFAGFAKTDPAEKYFPLLPGLKSLKFQLMFCIGSEEEKKLLEIKNRPFFQDPRDYGILLLYQDEPIAIGNNPNDTQSLIAKL
ncbi:hypothetical protein PPL_03937 [Heterostelium album PN500]|uniref:Glycylpeptide N-tetradecanoyltransferase n=1 Tax=Heterostelium pallidum (strain ATCC 26659 / Pp 5 / PN500) TaxID=670386 RepID=D3B5J9_HETP5|nr:hypothetical protein PPL_03937 [Heterostelium album PN500]EFA83147.1 hypothetical protein PPL_03937 [Heterostelium album PN500]|eukprot:XP_020435264.1 hypothetical protein PPL_03937 [Heterostelium album PN500]